MSQRNLPVTWGALPRQIALRLQSLDPRVSDHPSPVTSVKLQRIEGISDHPLSACHEAAGGMANVNAEIKIKRWSTNPVHDQSR